MVNFNLKGYTFLRHFVDVEILASTVSTINKKSNAIDLRDELQVKNRLHRLHFWQIKILRRNHIIIS